MILLDTNILVRLANRDDVDYRTTLDAIAGCLRKGHKLYVSDQTLQEFWVVCTRPKKNNGIGGTPERANQFLSQFTRIFEHLDDPPKLFNIWHNLVTSHAIVGLRSYDARLAAFALGARIDRLMTYNNQHFSKFPLSLVDPHNPSTW